MVYVLKVKSDLDFKLSNEIVLAVLNSRAMTYYLLKKYGETDWRSHPYLTQTSLKKLPFPDLAKISKTYKVVLDDLTRQIRRFVKRSEEVNINKRLDLRIERLVADLYGLTKSDYQKIYSALGGAEQLIPIKRLMKFSVNEIFDDGV